MSIDVKNFIQFRIDNVQSEIKNILDELKLIENNDYFNKDIRSKTLMIQYYREELERKTNVSESFKNLLQNLQ